MESKMELIASELRSRGHDARIYRVNRSNITSEGLVIKEDGINTSPVIYESFLHDASIPEMADQVEFLHELYLENGGDYKIPKTKEEYLSGVRMAVCRYDWNEERMANAVNCEIGETDLRLYFRYVVKDGLSCDVSKDLCKEFGISFDDLFDAAEANTEYQIINMAEIVGYPTDVGGFMYVITNRDSLFGASAIRDHYILNEAMKRLGSNRLLVIPSSVHEIIVVPDDGEILTAEFTASMIKDVNSALLEERERLSDHPYIFDGEVLSNS